MIEHRLHDRRRIGKPRGLDDHALQRLDAAVVAPLPSGPASVSTSSPRTVQHRQPSESSITMESLELSTSR